MSSKMEKARAAGGAVRRAPMADTCCRRGRASSWLAWALLLWSRRVASVDDDARIGAGSKSQSIQNSHGISTGTTMHDWHLEVVTPARHLQGELMAIDIGLAKALTGGGMERRPPSGTLCCRLEARRLNSVNAANATITAANANAAQDKVSGLFHTAETCGTWTAGITILNLRCLSLATTR